MTTYKVREFDNIDDADLIRCCVCVQEMRRTLLGLLMQVVDQLTKNPLTMPTRVAWAIVDRIVEGALSVELLCVKNRARDAAILLLNLYELRLDLQYMSLDVSRANIWIDHELENKKPWSVARQLKEIYTEPRERDAEFSVYRQYSMTKHGNPLGGCFSFPTAPTRHMLTLDEAKKNSAYIWPHIFLLGGCVEIAGKAASEIWRSQGLDVGDFAARLRDQWNALSRFNELRILSFLQNTNPGLEAGEGAA